MFREASLTSYSTQHPRTIAVFLALPFHNLRARWPPSRGKRRPLPLRQLRPCARAYASVRVRVCMIRKCEGGAARE